MKHQPQRPVTARQTAACLLADWLRSGILPEDRMNRLTADRPFIMETVYGVVRRWRTLEWILQSRLRRMPRPEVSALLMLGLYQLLFMDHVEDYAAVHETVEDVRHVAGEGVVKLANAVLRRVQRERLDILAHLERQPPGVRWSHPDILVERWTREWGPEKTAALCAGNNQRPTTCLRVYPSRINPAEFAERLAASDIAVRPHPFDPARCLELPSGVRVSDLPGYGEGWFVIQDPATLAATDLLAPTPGDTVLDACAAPGGKTSALAESLGGSGLVAAVELQADRFNLLQENLRRLRWPNICPLRADARSVEDLRRALAAANAPPLFDRILLDVPCTNTGVLRRRVDARWRFSIQRLDEMTQTQRALLDAATAFLKPGGKLVYSTCSLEPEENEGMVNGWLRDHPDYELQSDRRLFPPETNTDGAYAALLRCGKKTS